jgi:hypothetical protein
LNLLALVNFMRLSLVKAAHVVVSSAAKQEIWVRSGRDDKFVELRTGMHPLDNSQFPCNKFAISTGVVMGLWPTQADEISCEGDGLQAVHN